MHDEDTTQPIRRKPLRLPPGPPAGGANGSEKREGLLLTLALMASAFGFLGFFAAWILLKAESPPGRTGVIPFRPSWIEGPSFEFFLQLGLLFTLSFVALWGIRWTPLSRRGASLPRIGAAAALVLSGFALELPFAEWGRWQRSGFHLDGFELPTLEGETRSIDTLESRLSRAKELFGGRDLRDQALSPSFSEGDYLSLPLLVVDRSIEDLRPLQPGVIHSENYGIPARLDRAAQSQGELRRIRESLEPEGLGSQIAAERAAGARISSPYPALAYLTTAFLALHAAVFCLCLLLRLILTTIRPPADKEATRGLSSLSPWALFLAIQSFLIAALIRV